MNKVFAFVTLVLLHTSSLLAQDSTNISAKYLTWGVLQLLPSPTFIQDRNETDSRVAFGLRWQVIPINISFRANKYVSPVQFFMINPARRVTGSMEIFVQPEWIISSLKYSQYNKFGLSTGTRILFPLKNYGETISASVGGKYTLRKDGITGKDGYFGAEAGIYFLYGILGFQFNYNFKAKTDYNLGIYIKYF